MKTPITIPSRASRPPRRESESAVLATVVGILIAGAVLGAFALCWGIV